MLSSRRCHCCCCWVASVMSHSARPHRQQPTRLPLPWDSPGKNSGVGCHFLLQCMRVKSESDAQLCPTLSDPMDCSLPGSSVHGIFQARVLEWGATAFCEEMSLAGKKSIFKEPKTLKFNDNDPFKCNWNIFEKNHIFQDILDKIYRYKFCMVFLFRFDAYYLRHQLDYFV